jgi:hypothetical protein
MSNSVSLLRSYCGEWAGVYRHHCYWYESLALAVVDLIDLESLERPSICLCGLNTFFAH